MAINPKKNYTQTKGKIRTLWDIATQLVADFERFDKRLTELENKVDSLSHQVDSTVNGLSNVQ